MPDIAFYWKTRYDSTPGKKKTITPAKLPIAGISSGPGLSDIYVLWNMNYQRQEK
jgi:hypothetical protein